MTDKKEFLQKLASLMDEYEVKSMGSESDFYSWVDPSFSVKFKDSSIKIFEDSEISSGRVVDAALAL